MSLDVTRKIRGYLVSSSIVTAYVPARKIKAGWPRTLDEFPCIIISQVGGSDYGYLGYGTSTAGSKIREEMASIQVDIYSKNSRLETIQIGDEVVKELISGNCRKNTDFESYNDELGLYRKTQTYEYTQFHDD
jgi:hypothetical protein